MLLADHVHRGAQPAGVGVVEQQGVVRGAELEPIRHVTRELTRPDGTKLVVKIPVYPPFQLRDRTSVKEGRGRTRDPEKKAS